MPKPDHTSRPVGIPSGRLTRMARMGVMGADIAGRMAWGRARALGTGQRPSARELLMTPANIRRLTDELAHMRGAAMKMGQLMSMDTGDVLPPELAQIMARLRADADFMPPRQLRDVLDAAWGTGWMKRFAHFDVRPIAAASIGQVHRARLPDGTELAIKVQYPGVARSIDSDVANIGRLIRLSGTLPDGFELTPYLDEARLQLREETDYAAEAAHLQRFVDLLGDDPAFTLPRLHAPLCTPSVLAMTYLPSQGIETLMEAPQDTRDRVMHSLCALMLREVFAFGVMQTDPNFANYRFDAQTGRVVLLDFGATREIPATLAGQLRDLQHAGMAGDDAAVSDLVAHMGLVPHDVAPAPRARILAMIADVFDEVRDNPTLDLATSTLAKRLQTQGEALARDGFVPPPVPMDLLYVQRKIAGMFLLATRLGARIPVADLIETEGATP